MKESLPHINIWRSRSACQSALRTAGTASDADQCESSTATSVTMAICKLYRHPFKDHWLLQIAQKGFNSCHQLLLYGQQPPRPQQVPKGPQGSMHSTGCASHSRKLTAANSLSEFLRWSDAHCWCSIQRYKYSGDHCLPTKSPHGLLHDFHGK
jgi:hypothetical protein